jgi:hypothetical protein
VIPLVLVRRRTVETGPVGEVCLDPNDRLDVVGPGGLHEVDHSVEVPVIGDADGWLTHRRGLGYHILDPGRTIEE